MAKLTFNEFMEAIKEMLPTVLPEEYKDSRILLHKVLRNNGQKLQAICITPSSVSVAPNIYLEPFYQDYLDDKTYLEKVVYDIRAIFLDNIDNEHESIVDMLMDYNKVKGKIIAVVINYDKNMELLKDVPHLRQDDLAIIYKILVASDENETATITIKKPFLETWGIEEAELQKIALQNTMQTFPPVVMKISEEMEGLRNAMREDGVPEYLISLWMPELPEISPKEEMYIITNKHKSLGAISMFMPDVLANLAEKVEADLYILPSSTNEVLAISAETGPVEHYKEMVGMINNNSGAVSEEEVLSDNVYYYDRRTKKLSVAVTE